MAEATITYAWWYESGENEQDGEVAVAIGGAPHQVSIPALNANLSFNWDWSELTGTIGGTSVTGQPVNIRRDIAVKWDDIPDKTLGGVLPDENKVNDLVLGDYDKVNLTYGSIFLGENTLPVIITQK